MTRYSEFEGTPATLVCHGGSKHMLKVDGKKMFHHDWHHKPRHISGDWYKVTKGIGWTSCFVKINQDVARHASMWEHIKLGHQFSGADTNLVFTGNLSPMSKNNDAQIK